MIAFPENENNTGENPSDLALGQVNNGPGKDHLSHEDLWVLATILYATFPDHSPLASELVQIRQLLIQVGELSSGGADDTQIKQIMDHWGELLQVDHYDNSAEI